MKLFFEEKGSIKMQRGQVDLPAAVLWKKSSAADGVCRNPIFTGRPAVGTPGVAKDATTGGQRLFATAT
jgi:hypothetical protein